MIEEQDMTPDDQRFYARERMTELVYSVQHPPRFAIDPVKLRKAQRALKVQRLVQLLFWRSLMVLCGAVVTAAILAFLWGLVMLAWAGFGE